MSLLIHNIGLLATPFGFEAKAGKAQGEVFYLDNAYIFVRDGLIDKIGQGKPDEGAEHLIDAGGCLVTPGLVDAHTHLVFGGWREHELPLKLSGVPYLDILAQGGGILSTVRATRAATREELKNKALKILSGMLRHGTTTCEAKSGYGLNLETELKQLRTVKDLNKAQPIRLVSTFMGAHALPEEYRYDRNAYIDLLIDQMLPKAAEEKLAEFCDIFCESGVFSADEARRVLKAAQMLGLGAKIHADEINAIGGSELAGELGAVSAEHLIAATDEGIAAMARSGVIACLLPATSFYLGKPYARARDMMAQGVPVCLATDFNPGSCPSFNLQLAMNLACWHYRMLPAEVLTGVTLNAAAAIGLQKEIGTLQPGKRADIILWNADNLDYIFYRFGENLVRKVIKDGRLVCEN